VLQLPGGNDERAVVILMRSITGAAVVVRKEEKRYPANACVISVKMRIDDFMFIAEKQEDEV